MQEFVLDAADKGVDVELVAFRADETVSKAASSVLLVPSIAGPFFVRFSWFWVYTTCLLLARARVPTITCGAITGIRPDALWLHFWHHEHLVNTGWFCAWQGSLLRFMNQSVARFVAWLAELWSLSIVKVPVLIAVSNSQRQSLQRRFPNRSVLCLPNPVNTVFDIASEADERKVPRILFLGGEWGRKGLRLVARAANASGQRRRARTELLVIGKGPATVISELRRLKWLDVKHIPWTDNVQGYLQAVDLFVLASRYETFAMAGHEALGAGVPVVTTDVHGLAESVRDTGLGQVVGRREKTFEIAISEELERPRSAWERRQAAVWISERFSKEAVSRSRSEVIAATVNRHAR